MKISVYYLLALLIAPNIRISNSMRSAGVHQCVHATRKLSKQGDGKTPTSCFNCDPAQPTCYFGCQDLIDLLYTSCDEQCLPDGYYYDNGKFLMCV